MQKQGIQAQHTVILERAESEDGIEIESPGVEAQVVGRNDGTYSPDVDLSVYNALEFGISRRHAAFVRYRGAVHLVDLGSMNGTFINGERLLPQNPYALYDGDQVSFARLDMTVRQELSTRRT